ncbi:MAG: DNA repair protein RecO [Rikenellaceae bacterium]
MAQMSVYKGRGVVLHTLKYGENAMIVHLLTDVGGRQSFIVQGVRSGRGRGSKAALFQPLFTVEFEGLNPSKGELHRFREVRNGITLRRTPFDIRRSSIALFIAEVLYRLVRESGPNERLFERIWYSIEALDSIDDGVANFHLWFLVKLSDELGFRPSGRYVEGGWFDIREGQFCASQPSSGIALSPSETALLARLMSCEVNRLGEVELNRAERVAFIEAMQRYYGYHLDSMPVIESLAILRELF